MEIPEIIFRPEKKTPLKIDKKEYISACDFSLTENEIEKARKDLFETEEKKIRKLQELRDLLASDKDVIYRTDTPYLLRFLRVRKYDTIKAYKNIKEVYVFKKKHPELCSIPANIDLLMNRNIFMNLPYTDEEGNFLFYYNLANWKPQETSFAEMMQVSAAIIELMTMNPRVQVNGVIAIWDVKGLTALNVSSVVKNFGVKGMSFFGQGLYPWRVKKLLVLNAGPISQLLLAMVQPLLSNKLLNRIIMLGSDIKELHQHVDPVLLPNILGGFLEDCQRNCYQNIIDNIPYLKYEASFTSAEKL